MIFSEGGRVPPQAGGGKPWQPSWSAGTTLPLVHGQLRQGDVRQILAGEDQLQLFFFCSCFRRSLWCLLQWRQGAVRPKESLPTTLLATRPTCPSGWYQGNLLWESSSLFAGEAVHEEHGEEGQRLDQLVGAQPQGFEQVQGQTLSWQDKVQGGHTAIGSNHRDKVGHLELSLPDLITIALLTSGHSQENMRWSTGITKRQKFRLTFVGIDWNSTIWSFLKNWCDHC